MIECTFKFVSTESNCLVVGFDNVGTRNVHFTGDTPVDFLDSRKEVEDEPKKKNYTLFVTEYSGEFLHAPLCVFTAPLFFKIPKLTLTPAFFMNYGFVNFGMHFLHYGF